MECSVAAVIVETATKPSCFVLFWQGAESLVPATQYDIQTSKSAPHPSIFPLLTSKCASHHNGLHFSTSQIQKVFRTLQFFSTFNFEMCFAPQRRALFRHRNFQKWSENGVFFVHFDKSSKYASRHNGMHFFDISISKSGPKLVCVLYMLLGNVLRATTAYIFSTYQLPKVV